MLTGLVIRNVVLIESLSLDGAAGLCALTGETGAGKSILLDALGLALGARADAALVRHGAEQAGVTAVFALPGGHPLHEILKDKGIDAGGEVILRRVLSRDGRSRAFINDSPVSVQFLKEAGAALVEIHGQFETQGLLDPATHRRALDVYAGLLPAVTRMAASWKDFRVAQEKLEAALASVESLRLQEDYLRHAVSELERLEPKPGEEDVLAEKRAALLGAEKLRAARDQAAELLEGENGVQSLLGRLQALLEKTGAAAPAVEALSRARAEAEEASFQISRVASGGAGDLAAVEDRYFALKACAKKHRCAVEGLPALHADMAGRLRLITHQDDALADLEKAVRDGRAVYAAQAEKIAAARRAAAGKLAVAVQAELPGLKMDRARFSVDCAALPESAWGPEGTERVQFTVSTNPQAPAGPLHRIASGGELARFMLALKAVMAGEGFARTLIFDEVDSGIGGAVAAAVGEKLARLARGCQVLVVTHSPQVAALAAHHWRVSKDENGGASVTRIVALSAAAQRQEEIARMLSGAKVTPEARAQARKLLENRDAAA